MTKPITLLEPKLLGFWVRCIRQAQHMSQDALAAVSGVDIRTIQRMEAGNIVNVTTRRCIARGLGYENPDAFDDPEFGLEVHGLLEGMHAIQQKAFERQNPDRVRVKAERVLNGEALGRFADAANAVSLNADDGISQEAKEVAAALFDYVRDLIDVRDDASFSDKLGFNEYLGTMLRELEGFGTVTYSAFRSVKMTGENWTDKTPLQLTIGYLTVVPAREVLEEMFVPRRVRLG